MREVKEVQEYAKGKGMISFLKADGQSYRLGANLFLFPKAMVPEGIDEKCRMHPVKWDEFLKQLKNVKIEKLDFVCCSGRCLINVWAIKMDGEFRSCTEADYDQSAESERLVIGAETHQMDYRLFFTKAETKELTSDMDAAFASVGL